MTGALVARIAAVLFWVGAAGLGLSCLACIRSLAAGRGTAVVLGYPTFGGGPFERHGIPTSIPLVSAFLAVCLLDASPEAQAERLAARGDDPTLLIHHQAFAEWMRRQAIDPLHMTHVVSHGGWEDMR